MLVCGDDVEVWHISFSFWLGDFRNGKFLSPLFIKALVLKPLWCERKAGFPCDVLWCKKTTGKALVWGGRFPRISEVELTEFSAVSAVIFIFSFLGWKSFCLQWIIFGVWISFLHQWCWLPLVVGVACLHSFKTGDWTCLPEPAWALAMTKVYRLRFGMTAISKDLLCC